MHHHIKNSSENDSRFKWQFTRQVFALLGQQSSIPCRSGWLVSSFVWGTEWDSFSGVIEGGNERHKVSQRETELRENILHLERARKRVYLFVGIWLCPVVSSGQSIWLGTEGSVDGDCGDGLRVPIVMVTLPAVWSSMSMTSKVMLGSPPAAWAGSDVRCRGGIHPFKAPAWVAVWGFSGGRQALRFLRMGFLGAGSSFCAPSPEDTQGSMSINRTKIC